MHDFFNILIDFIFPPSALELKLRSITPEKFPSLVPKAQSAEFPFIFSLFSYKDPLVKELIWQIKYKKNKHAIKIAAYALEKALKDTDVTLIPIPISRARRNERGYNQCELIIYEIKGFPKDFNLLIRSKHIDKQTFKNRNQRIENTKNIFEVTRKPKENEKIMIIDDVTTTGSTLREAREILLQNGFSIVETLTVAH